MVHFSTQQEIEPDRWDAKGNRTLGLRAEERTINRILDEIKASLHRYYYDCQASGESVSALKLKNKLCSTEEKPIILNIGSAGSAKYPIGEIVNVRSFVNGGSELIYDRIDLPVEGATVFSGDYFMSTQTFPPEQVKVLSEQYDLFDMEAYAAALFCQERGLPFYCLKAVSDNLDGTLKDWRGILGDIREKFVELLRTL